MSAFEALHKLGAGDFQHLNGSLETHLRGTAALLEKWGADPVWVTAGLFHAAYGTAGFDEQMVNLDQRQRIAEIIGQEAESLVYLYCSCDRGVVFPQFGQGNAILFKDRFTQESFELPEQLAQPFCELTVANELELVFTSPEFEAKHGPALRKLFKGMESYLSREACAAYKVALRAFA